MDENETDSDLGSWADDISRPPFDLSKNRYGVTREPAPGIEALRSQLKNAGLNSALADFENILNYEANRLAEAQRTLENQDQTAALKLIAAQIDKFEAEGEKGIEQPVQQQPQSTNPEPVREIPSHPEVPGLCVNALLLSPLFVFSNRSPPSSKVDSAFENAQAAYDIAKSAEEEVLMGRCQFYLARVTLVRGSVKRAKVLFKEVAELASSTREGEWARKWLVECEKIIDERGGSSASVSPEDGSVAASPTSPTASASSTGSAGQKGHKGQERQERQKAGRARPARQSLADEVRALFGPVSEHSEDRVDSARGHSQSEKSVTDDEDDGEEVVAGPSTK